MQEAFERVTGAFSTCMAKQAAASAGSGAQQRVNLSEIGHSEIEHLKRAALRSGPFLLDFKGMKTTASPSGEQAIEHRRPHSSRKKITRGYWIRP